jgi:CRP-like cAMP-binding protein
MGQSIDGGNERDARKLAEGILAKLVPFRFLRAETRESLAHECALERRDKGQPLAAAGERGDAVRVLLSGSAESVDEGRNPPFRVNVLEEGSAFGEMEAVFPAPRPYLIRALEPCVALAVPKDRFVSFLSESRSFALAVGSRLRETLGIFDAFEAFAAEVRRLAAAGHIEVRRLIPAYSALAPALHRGARDDSAIDWTALAYAVRRLPADVTRTFVFLLTDNLPTVYASPELLFPAVASEARHRFVYSMLPGKDMVLVRSGDSDLMDFVTCLCLFAIEARKIRYRLNHPDLILSLSGGVDSIAIPESPFDGQGMAVVSAPAAPKPAMTLADMPFDEAERAEISELWPDCPEARIREIVFHRQAYSIDVRKQVNNYNTSLSEQWTSQVGEAAKGLMGRAPSEFGDEIDVHIVSSNTHSVSNCLNPWFQYRKADVLSWADGAGLRTPGWPREEDEVYHLARAYFSAHPKAKGEMLVEERAAGLVRLPERVTTGIQVQLVDAGAIGRKVIDPGVRYAQPSKPSLFVNIDYAFGEQAEEIARNLLMLFGRSLRSINVLGKAGALLGSRGDVLMPTAFVEQQSDDFQPVPDCGSDCAKRLRDALPGRTVHRGPLLTVGGTLLQNETMLSFYKLIWSCVGIEMEGAYYWRAIRECEQLGVADPDARKRFFYYVSDLPLAQETSLASRMAPQEGIPPLYAITRETLSLAFSDGVAPWGD